MLSTAIHLGAHGMGHLIEKLNGLGWILVSTSGLLSLTVLVCVRNKIWICVTNHVQNDAEC